MENRVALRETAVATAAALLALIPFVGKAFTMDDPMFLWAARRIAESPFDPYGFTVHWYERPLPMWLVMKNPPLGCYYMALAGKALGWSERALHAAFLVPAAAAIAGTGLLARRLCGRPMFAALATLASPVFLVSSTNVMSDVLMLAFWVWAVLLWIEGLERERAWSVVSASVLAAAASLTKYFGAGLLPLLGLYAVLRKKRPSLWLPPLLLPVAALTGFQLWTGRLYGRGLLLEAAGYAAGYPGYLRSLGYSAWSRFLSGFVFAGGCALPVLMLAPLLWPRRALLAIGGAALAVAAIYPLGWRSGPLETVAARWSVLVWLQAGFLAAGGIALLSLALADLRSRRDPDSVLLALWVFGTFLFGALVNWDVNGRSVLPLAPVAAILASRRLAPPDGKPPHAAWKTWAPVGLSAAVALLVAWGDASLAGVQRDAAARLRRMADARGVATLWYQGHWGFQHYMDSAGGRPFDGDVTRLKPGDWVVIPWNNSNVYDLPPSVVAETREISEPNSAPAATMSPDDAAGFYASILGPLPYSLGPASPERYTIDRIGGTGGP